MSHLYLQAYICLESNIFHPNFQIMSKIKTKNIDLFQNSSDFSERIGKQIKKSIDKSIGETGTLPREILIHYHIENTMHLDFVTLSGNLSKNTSQEVDFVLYQLRERMRITISEELALEI